MPQNIQGEWIELTNASTQPADLAGCVLVSGVDEMWPFEDTEPLDLVIAPGQAHTVARSSSSFYTKNARPKQVWEGLALANEADWLQLVCDGVVVDTVAWDVEDDWTIPVQRFLSLSGNRTDAVENDFAGAWCAVDAHSSNAPNPVCPADDILIDDCVTVAVGGRRDACGCRGRC